MGAACPKRRCKRCTHKGKFLCRKKKTSRQAMRMKAGVKAWKAHKEAMKGDPPKGAYQKFLVPYLRGIKK